MSNSAWCDLNSKSDTFKLHYECPSLNCTCQKQITFTTKQFQLPRGSVKTKSNQFSEEHMLLGINLQNQRLLQHRLILAWLLELNR